MVCLRRKFLLVVCVLWTVAVQTDNQRPPPPPPPHYPSVRQQELPWPNYQAGQGQNYDPNYNQYQLPGSGQGSYHSLWQNFYQNSLQNWPNTDPRTFRPASLPETFKYVKPDISHLTQTVTIPTELGSITGKIVYLFDTPDIPYYLRPGTPSVPVAKVQTSVNAFLGIPYAQAPIGDRRFKPPERMGGLHSLRATEYRPACPQPLYFQEQDKGISVNEDCLFLNIFTPSLTQGSSYLPVMIYIHGGEFESGSGNLFPGHMMAASQQVVVVTFNYRLGALGFLSTGDEVSPGNYGMLDQAMAIRWVHDNIHNFRGDKSLITLFGPDAGAASAGLHLISPRTRDYVRRVIAQSGSALADWAAVTNLERARNTSRVFGMRMGCAGESSWKRVDCLKQRSAKDLSNTDIKPELGYFAWAPVVDKDIQVEHDDYRFLPEDPRTLFSSRHFNPYKEYLAGVTRDEAAHLLLRDFSLVSNNFEITQEYFNRKVKEYILQYNYTLNQDGVYHAIVYMYTHWADPSSPRGLREQYINMMSDALYKAPNDEVVKLLVKSKVKTFMYVLNTTVEGFLREPWEAVDHDTEYYFLTGAPFMEREFFPPYKLRKLSMYGWTEGDRNMSMFFMKTFANFAKQGVPTSLKVLDIDWKPMEKTTEIFLNYLNINNSLNTTMERDYRQLECAFWTNYMPLVIGPPPSTTISPYEQQLELQIGFYSATSVAVLFFILLFITCCLYCRASDRHHYNDYEDSMVPEDSYSNNHTEMAFVQQKNENNQQHTTV